jgi:hypothetical protein
MQPNFRKWAFSHIGIGEMAHAVPRSVWRFSAVAAYQFVAAFPFWKTSDTLAARAIYACGHRLL